MIPATPQFMLPANITPKKPLRSAVQPPTARGRGNIMNTEERLSLECTICGRERDLVRDHNHNTGFVRGILCDMCNRRLGAYCKNMFGKKTEMKGYKSWLDKYEGRIKEFLSGTAGIQYDGFRSEVLLEKMRRKGVQLNGTKYKEPDVDTSRKVSVNNNFIEIII